MESKKSMPTTKEARIRAQIASLEAELRAEASRKARDGEENATIFAPATPSPKKRKLAPVKAVSRSVQPAAPAHLRPASKTAALEQVKQSSLVSSLSKISHEASPDPQTSGGTRSTSFSDKPSSAKEVRNENLILVENLQKGPCDHPPPTGDPTFQSLEPNSGIRLSERTTSHSELQDLLVCRYYISPSKLYSIVRELPSNQGYEIPVDDDWITIAVVAEKSPVKITTPGLHPQESLGTSSGQRQTGVGRKYLSLKLVDLGRRGFDACGAKQTIHGDALLNMLLFESTPVQGGNSTGTSRSNGKRYGSSGSGGAYEECVSLTAGSVIAILNPQILKPNTRAKHGTSTKPHPRNNILSITPPSAESVLVIGRAMDLGWCQAVKRDGKPCDAWLDKRLAGGQAVCEYHFDFAVRRNRNARAEFTAGTSGMSSTGRAPKQEVKHDRFRRFDQLPGEHKGLDGEALYVHSDATTRPHAADQAVGDKIGRGRQERLKRKREALEAEETLANLLNAETASSVAKAKVKRARRALASQGTGDFDEPSDQDETLTGPGVPGQNYGANLIKQLGFNPVGRLPRKSTAATGGTDRLKALQAASMSGEATVRSRQETKKRSSLRIPGRKEVAVESDDELELEEEA